MCFDVLYFSAFFSLLITYCIAFIIRIISAYMLSHYNILIVIIIIM